MKIEIVEKNYDVGVRLRDLIEKKVGKLDKYFGEKATCKVVCKKDNKQHKIEINISSKNAFFRSEVIGDNMYTNLDIALPKLEKQILRFKDKRKDNFIKLPDIKELLFLDEIPEEKAPIISKRKSFSLDPITEEDAIYMLEAGDHDFYVFLNAETGRTNVIYRRKDEEYGLIDIK